MARWVLVLFGALGVATAVGVGWLRRSWTVITVVGSSMEPTYHDGDRVAVRKTARIAAGDVVVVQRPSGEPGWPDAEIREGGRWLIKRVAAVAGEPVPDVISIPDTVVPEGRLVLLGDNAAASFDSRMVGYFPIGLVLGGVVRRMR
jgi:signal peptidase I